MDDETRNLFRSQQEFNRHLVNIIVGVSSRLDAQQNLLRHTAEFVSKVAAVVTGAELEPPPALPTAEELAEQAADIAELRRLLNLDSEPPTEH